MSHTTKQQCVVPLCSCEAAPNSTYCITHHVFNEECDMVDAVSGDEVIGKVCAICGAEEDYSDD